MKIVTMVLTGIYLVALLVLLWVSRRHKGRYALAKGVCSTLFVLCAGVSWQQGTQRYQADFLLLGAGLVLCAAGDVLLGVANQKAKAISKRPFVFGAGCFLLAHGLFCVLFFRKRSFAPVDLLLSVLLMIVLFLLEKAGKVRLKKMRPLGYVYTAVVGLMAGKAVQVLGVAPEMQAGAVLLCVGAALFLLSDVILLFLYFGTVRSPWLRGANLLSYYSGVWLMALAAGWL